MRDWLSLGWWMPWHETREWRKHGIMVRYGVPTPWPRAHGWIHLRLGRWHWQLSWDRLEYRTRPDYDAVP